MLSHRQRRILAESGVSVSKPAITNNGRLFFYHNNQLRTLLLPNWVDNNSINPISGSDTGLSENTFPLFRTSLSGQPASTRLDFIKESTETPLLTQNVLNQRVIQSALPIDNSFNLTRVGNQLFRNGQSIGVYNGISTPIFGLNDCCCFIESLAGLNIRIIEQNLNNLLSFNATNILQPISNALSRSDLGIIYQFANNITNVNLIEKNETSFKIGFDCPFGPQNVNHNFNMPGSYEFPWWVYFLTTGFNNFIFNQVNPDTLVLMSDFSGVTVSLFPRFVSNTARLIADINKNGIINVDFQFIQFPTFLNTFTLNMASLFSISSFSSFVAIRYRDGFGPDGNSQRVFLYLSDDPNIPRFNNNEMLSLLQYQISGGGSDGGFNATSILQPPFFPLDVNSFFNLVYQDFENASVLKNPYVQPRGFTTGSTPYENLVKIIKHKNSNAFIYSNRSIIFNNQIIQRNRTDIFPGSVISYDGIMFSNSIGQTLYSRNDGQTWTSFQSVGNSVNIGHNNFITEIPDLVLTPQQISDSINLNLP